MEDTLSFFNELYETIPRHVLINTSTQYYDEFEADSKVKAGTKKSKKDAKKE